MLKSLESIAKSIKPAAKARPRPIAPAYAPELFNIVMSHSRAPDGALRLATVWRRRPMIATLHDQDFVNDDEYRALYHYRHHADLADRSPVRDSLCLERGGRGAGPTATLVNALQTVRRIETAAGALAPILRAVVVYDTSLAAWAMARGGTVERRRMKRGREVTALEPHGAALELARSDMREAIGRVIDVLSGPAY